MPRAILLDDLGNQTEFDLDFCPVHVEYRNRLWALMYREPGSTGDYIYRQVHGLMLRESQRILKGPNNANTITAPFRFMEEGPAEIHAGPAAAIDDEAEGSEAS